MGTERFKGSHSMSGYHSSELCYLAAVYTNLLITKQPMDFYFKPQPGGFKDNILRVAPDILPEGSVRSARSGSTARSTRTSTRRADGQACRTPRSPCGQGHHRCRKAGRENRYDRQHPPKSSDDVHVVELAGELDANTSPVAQQQILPLATEGSRSCWT
jgi:hypothetical protein